jgi:hypothetical protein
MTTTALRAAALTLVICTAAPATARADFLVEPFFAWTHNNETSRSVPGGGVAAEWSSGWLLVGGDFGYASGYFDPAEDVLDLVATSSVLTLGGHVGIGMPAEGGKGRYFPYFTGGLGLMRQVARDREGLIDVQRNDPALNFGGGIRVLVNNYLGVRGDVRYFRSLRDPFDNADPIVADLDRVHFWRIALGAVIRFGWD